MPAYDPVMDPTEARRRGRPPKPTEHPVGARMRQRRSALGLTVRDLATRVGLRESSASYLSQLESGAKTPHPRLARRLAEALRDEPRIYLAWAATGKRSDPIETARAVRTLAEMLPHREYAAALSTGAVVGELAARRSPEGPPAVAADEAQPESLLRAQSVPGGAGAPDSAPSRGLPGIPAAPPAGDVPQAKLLVPELEEGADPAEHARGGPRIVATHRIAAESLAGIEPPVRPYALRVSAAAGRRVRDLLAAGDLAILSRRSWPLDRFAPHALWISGRLVLSRLLWNGRQLLLLPGPEDSDFIVLDAPDRTALERLIAGKVIARVLGHERAVR